MPTCERDDRRSVLHREVSLRKKRHPPTGCKDKTPIGPCCHRGHRGAAVLYEGLHPGCRFPGSLSPSLGGITPLSAGLPPEACSPHAVRDIPGGVPGLCEEPLLRYVSYGCNPAIRARDLRGVAGVCVDPVCEVHCQHIVHHPALIDNQDAGYDRGGREARSAARVHPHTRDDGPLHLCLCRDVREDTDGDVDQVFRSPRPQPSVSL